MRKLRIGGNIDKVELKTRYRRLKIRINSLGGNRMKKILSLALILLLSVSLFGCVKKSNETSQEKELQQKEEPQKAEEIDKETVADLVEAFGNQLQFVSLQGPQDIVKKSMQENYGDFVSQSLLARWISDPVNALGRLTSSPWPDRIEVLSIEGLSESAYEVKGEIVEITSADKENGRTAARQPITLVLRKINDHWLIDEVTLGAYEETNGTIYKNTEYGFRFFLPESWKGYEIMTDKWEGLASGDSENKDTNETGPMISIRHPQWTSQNQRQDIPIMIFTLGQWNALQQGKFHIGAAPMGPSELGRNTKYVFALPARYNYAFPTGYEEVENILKGNPLQPMESESLE
ncbi:hypothetical protein [Anaerosolibacter carboniphilus]|nr:hypothetical protein [Anaerosolibacter carboniphilus]